MRLLFPVKVYTQFPTFLKSRIFIDMGDSLSRTENFEQLLRWIYDQPLHQRPERGKKPSHIFENNKISLHTTSRHHQAINALKQNKPLAHGLCQDFFDILIDNFTSMRINLESNDEFDDLVIESIDNFLPYRDEIIDVIMSIAKYRSNNEMHNLVHKFFERLLPFGYWPEGRQSWRESDADNYKFIINELFIYCIAAFLKHDKFDAINELLGQDYYFINSPDAPQDSMVPYTYFNGFCRSLSYRNSRLKLNRLSPIADLIINRAKRSDLSFNDIMQADFVLHLRADLNLSGKDIFRDRWMPHTLVYASFGRTPVFEIFARSQSSRKFDQMKVAVGIDKKEELKHLIEKYHNKELHVPKWQFDSVNASLLMNFDKLATKP